VETFSSLPAGEIVGDVWILNRLFPAGDIAGEVKTSSSPSRGRDRRGSRDLTFSFQRAKSPGKSSSFIFSVPRVNVSGHVETFFFPRVKSPGKLRPSNSSLPVGHILFLAGEISVDVDIFNFLLLARPTPRGLTTGLKTLILEYWPRKLPGKSRSFFLPPLKFTRFVETLIFSLPRTILPGVQRP
jgi:hypothetical protein